jgi:hypothetical protein
MLSENCINNTHTTDENEVINLAWFCQPPRPNLSKIAIQAAGGAKAFTCLPIELLDCVLQRFVDFVHPPIPVLDLDHTFRVFDRRERGDRISVLLWQAITTSTVPFLSGSELSKAGLVSTEASILLYLRRCEVSTRLKL